MSNSKGPGWRARSASRRYGETIAEVAQILVDAGADANARDSDGNPPLLEAIWRNHAGIVRILVAGGADVDARDSDGNPLLLEAIWRDHSGIVRILVDAGADVDSEDSVGNPLLLRSHMEKPCWYCADSGRRRM